MKEDVLYLICVDMYLKYPLAVLMSSFVSCLLELRGQSFTYCMRSFQSTVHDQSGYITVLVLKSHQPSIFISRVGIH